MDWLFNHPLLLLFVIVAVTNLAQKMKRASIQMQSRETTDADAAERTRRVQAEIRRKIAERMGGAPGQTPSVPPSPAVAPASTQRRPNVFTELARQMAEARRLAEAREREQAAADARAQQSVEAEPKSRERAEARPLAEAQRQLPKQPEATETAEIYGAAERRPAAMNAREKLLVDLREPAGLRRALVLREILDAPVGLR